MDARQARYLISELLMHANNDGRLDPAVRAARDMLQVFPEAGPVGYHQGTYHEESTITFQMPDGTTRRFRLVVEPVEG